MSDDSPTEVKASPPAGEEAGRAPAEAQGKPRPTGRFKRTLKDVADWAPPTRISVEWVVEKVLTGVLFVLGEGRWCSFLYSPPAWRSRFSTGFSTRIPTSRSMTSP